MRYSAYGYHGTEILIDGRYQWQTYTSYDPGQGQDAPGSHRPERLGRRASRPPCITALEIRTNSSDIFVGVELPLISLLYALKKENGGAPGRRPGRPATRCWPTATAWKTCWPRRTPSMAAR